MASWKTTLGDVSFGMAVVVIFLCLYVIYGLEEAIVTALFVVLAMCLWFVLLGYFRGNE